MSDQQHPVGPKGPELEQWIVAELAARLRLDPQAIDRRERFNRYGLDSMKATAFTGELSARLGRPLSPTLMWDHPSVEKLVNHLLAPDAAGAAPHAGPTRISLETVAPPPAHEPIAIVGLACRFPSAPDATAYWRLLAGGVDAIAEVPRDRWNLDDVFDADLSAPGKMNTRWGGFLDQVDRFDAQAFGISPREAAQMDPQQRLVLELCSEALDDAGVRTDGLRGTATGVFVGAMWSDYARLVAGNASGITQHTATGQDTSIISGRVSYFFGVQGPSLTVNTACSSSLVAVHLACQSLRSGESTLALAGGVSLVLSAESTVAMSKFGAMAADGRSKAFDARANGYVRGEGGGVVVLKPLSRAIADGDSIYCLLTGSAMNNDGFSNGLTAPNPQAQENVLRLAYANARVPTDQVQYVETHGTGTLLGDPIEAGALGAVLGSGRAADRPLVLGSVKTNIGHLEAAAGMAGLIKVALSIRHGLLPPSLHFQTPNPHIRFDDLRLRVQTQLGPWPRQDETPIAGVSSFGFGGTNCHVVVQGPADSYARLMTLAADSDEELRGRARGLVQQIDRRAGDAPLARDVADLVEDPGACDAGADARAGIVFGTPQELRRKLAGLADGVSLDGVAVGRAPRRRGGIVFVCSGHGSQWPGMARSLLQAEPVFRARLEECAGAIEAVAGWNAIDEIVADPARSRVEQFDITQPLLFAIQVSLAAVWRSWGVVPDAVVGHSMGEVAAACIAGALSIEDAARVICHRSRLLARMVGQGSIAILGLSRDEVERRFAAESRRLWVAACNGPSTTAVSGDPLLLQDIVNRLQADKQFARLANAGVPAHSPKVDPLRAELFESVREIRPRRNPVRMYSTVTAAVVGGMQLGPSYWVRNLREPVLFAQAVEVALNDGCDTFIELSPHPVLATGTEQCLERAGVAGLVAPSGRRNEDERRVMLETAARLFVEVCDVRVSDRHKPSETAGVSVPVVLSAFTPAALRERARSIAEFVRATEGVGIADVAYTAARRRTHLDHRLAVIAASREELADRLEAFARGEERAHTVSGRATDSPPRVAFVFCGQGPQWWAMGRELMLTEPVVADVISTCDRLIRRHAEWSLVDELGRDESTSRVDRLDLVQPAVFSIQVALAALWKSWGVVPSAVIGHSMGEVAAACVAGVLTLEDAVQTVVERGRMVQRVAGQGRTAAVDLGEPAAQALIEPYGGRVGIAAVNGPRSTTISGEPAAVADALRKLAEQGGLGRELRMDFASHSVQMDPLLDDLTAALSGITPRPAALPIYSTVTGRSADGWEFDGAYWARNLREPVMFAAAFGQMLPQIDVALELGPQPVLAAAMTDSAEASGAACTTLASLRRGQGERLAMLASVIALHAAGYPLNWSRVLPPGRCVSLPPYPWQRERHWLEPVRRPAASPARASAAQSATTTWYDVVWQPMASAVDAVSAGGRVSRQWLILVDSEGVGDAFAAARTQCGERCVVAQRAVGRTLHSLFADAFGAGGGERHVVYIAGLESPASEPAAHQIEAAALDACEDVRQIVHHLLESASAGQRAAQLSIVTHGAQKVAADDAPSVAQAPLWGLARVLALEYPQLWNGIVDLPGGATTVDVNAVAGLLVAGGGENQMALRGGRAYVARLVESPKAAWPGPVRLRADATYLITGGLGRLGSKVARWMVGRGARHLVLAGRRARNEESVRALENAGARVTVAHGDISDPSWVAALVEGLAGGDVPLRGVVHAAGVSTRRPLAGLDRQAFATDFAPKIRGAWLLHQATVGVPLDFFVMFSTAAAIWGARDMASYAAANHFLDALSQFRRQSGLEALSVSWGPWDEVGVMSDDVQRVWDRIGIPAMSESSALDALDGLIASGEATKTVACVDWDRFKAIHETRTRQPFLERVGCQAVASPDVPVPKPPMWLAALDGAAPEERQTRLMGLVQREVCDILGLDANTSLDPTRGFAQMGLDSLMAIELRDRLEKAMGRSLPSPVVFNYPNVRAMAAYLAGGIEQVPGPAVAASAASAPRLAVEEISELSDEEAEALLAMRLAALGRGSA